MDSTHTYPVAQLVDILPTWGWYAVLAGGLLAPVVGLLISLTVGTFSRTKGGAVATFYAISLWVGAMVVLAPRADGPQALSFYILLPVGLALGLWVLAPRRHIEGPRGFLVEPNPTKRADAGD
jgi:hypothetical protein